MNGVRKKRVGRKGTTPWYTSGDSFVFRVVSKVCASLDINGLFKIRLILCDLYKQLKELYNQQLEELRKNGLVVHRGVLMLKHELDAFKNIGEWCVTRPFLSTTTDESMAKIYAGHCPVNEEKVSVMMTMKIDSKQIDDSLLAHIEHVSVFPEEKEVMLFKGLVFRIESCTDLMPESTHSVHIQMVRGEAEVEIERKLRKKHLLLTSGGSSPLLSLFGLLKQKYYHQHVGIQPEQSFHNQQPSSQQVSEQFSFVTDTGNQPGNVSVFFIVTFNNDLLQGFHNLETLDNSLYHTEIELGGNPILENVLSVRRLNRFG